MLESPDPRAVLQSLTDARAPLYIELADLVVATDGRKVAAVAKEIADHVLQI